MTRPEAPARPTALAAAATTLMALMAVVATAQSAPAYVVGAVTTEAVLASESKAVRAVAAAVAAVAREILKGGQTSTAWATPDTPDPVPGRHGTWRADIADDEVRAATRLAERLLDLPPPTA